MATNETVFTSNLNNLITLASSQADKYSISARGDIPGTVSRGSDVNSSSPFGIAKFLGKAYLESGYVQRYLGRSIWTEVNNGVVYDIWENSYLIYTTEKSPSEKIDLVYLYNQLETLNINCPDCDEFCSPNEEPC